MARDITKLHPDLQTIVAQFQTKCALQGLNVLITECVRTQQEQDDLYAQGRTKPGSIVTQVKYPDSMHCWGVAFDFCRNVRGKEYDDSDGFFAKVGAVGKSLGLVWGGDWTSFVDKPHLEMKGYTTSSLKTQYGTPEKFFATWKSSSSGWMKENNVWKYYRNGVPVKGWQELDWNGKKSWYYFGDDGIMVTGPQIIKWSGGIDLFVFRSDGSLIMNASLKGNADANGAVKLDETV